MTSRGPSQLMDRFGRRRRHHGEPSLLSTASSFRLAPGRHVDSGDGGVGYYLDFSFKPADGESWPPPWFDPGEDLYVAVAQWALGCHERFLSGEGDAWLDAAIGAADFMVETQIRAGARSGGWPHPLPLRHTFRLPRGWLSAMAQGECASLLARVYRQTGEERYAESAINGMKPLRVPVRDGGVRAPMASGWFPEEYPTEPHSYVLNGALFALWGCHDVWRLLDDDRARELFEEGAGNLAANLGRFDLGYWSRYDLFPHPLVNVASGAYHWLHIDQLRAMSELAPHPEWADYADRFEAYGSRRQFVMRAFAAKVAFRLRVPRNELFADRLPAILGRRPR